MLLCEDFGAQTIPLSGSTNATRICVGGTNAGAQCPNGVGDCPSGACRYTWEWNSSWTSCSALTGGYAGTPGLKGTIAARPGHCYNGGGNCDQDGDCTGKCNGGSNNNGTCSDVSGCPGGDCLFCQDYLGANDTTGCECYSPRFNLTATQSAQQTLYMRWYMYFSPGYEFLNTIGLEKLGYFQALVDGGNTQSWRVMFGIQEKAVGNRTVGRFGMDKKGHIVWNYNATTLATVLPIADPDIQSGQWYCVEVGIKGNTLYPTALNDGWVSLKVNDRQYLYYSGQSLGTSDCERKCDTGVHTGSFCPNGRIDCGTCVGGGTPGAACSSDGGCAGGTCSGTCATCPCVDGTQQTTYCGDGEADRLNIAPWVSHYYGGNPCQPHPSQYTIYDNIVVSKAPIGCMPTVVVKGGIVKGGLRITR